MKWLIPLFLAFIVFIGCVQLPGQGAQPPSGTTQPPSGTTQPPSGTTEPPSGTTQPPSGTTQPPANATTQPPAGTAQPPSGTTSNKTTLKSTEFSYKSGAWKIYGTDYASTSKTPTKAIVLVPMLDHDRSSYPVSFIESLHNQFPEAVIIALDMRGHGESTNLGAWDSFDTNAYRDMRMDIINLRPQYIEPNYPDIEKIYVVGASMGSTAAILAATQDPYIHKIVMISPGMDYKGVDITRAVEDEYVHPLLAVASSGDSSAADVREIDSLRPNVETETKIYSGSAHGTDLFEATEGDSEPLSSLIVEFLK